MTESNKLFISLYTDEDITVLLAPAIRAHGLNAINAAEANMLNATDEAQLAYAAKHDMAILTYNIRDFLKLAKDYASLNRCHSGIIFSVEQFSIRRLGELLRLMLKLMNEISYDEMRNRVIYLQQFGKRYSNF